MSNTGAAIGAAAGSAIPGVGTAVGGFLGNVLGNIFGKSSTPVKSGVEVYNKYFKPYFDVVYQTYFSDNYFYKPVDQMYGKTFDISALPSKGIFRFGLVLFDKKTNTDKGILLSGTYGTMEDKINNAVMGGADYPIKPNIRSFPDDREIVEYSKDRYILNQKIQEVEKTNFVDQIKKQSAGILSGGVLMYAIIGIVILAMIYMFMKK